MIDKNAEDRRIKEKGKEVRGKYGKERMQILFDFLEKLNRYYGFPYHDMTLYDFAESLEKFTKEDLSQTLIYLEDRESTFLLKFNEIKNACKDARNRRIRIEKMNQKHEERTGRKMPEEIKKMTAKILKKGVEEVDDD